MSEQLIYVFLGDTPIHFDDAQVEGETPLLWKVVLRTGTWKLRPGPGGVKLNQPLKIYRDKAPKGHISMSELVKSFNGDDKGPAKEHVTLTQVHADGTTSDGGFVKKLVIQDVPGEDGSKAKESLLWAGLEVTDSALKTKLDEKSIRGCSGGILFDYQRTEDAKTFGQILSHVMATNSPWIGGTGDFQTQLPEGVMASEPDDLPVGEVEFSSRETDPQPQLPVVHLADPPATSTGTTSTTSTGNVLWRPEQGFRFAQNRVRKALDDWRQSIMASLPSDQRYTVDWPYFSVEDVSLSGSSGTALISSGYGPDCDSWVANFKLDAENDVELDPFAQWTPAKQEWVAASEEERQHPRSGSASTKSSASPAGRGPAAVRPSGGIVSLSNLGLREAQSRRAERTRLGASSTTTGGTMPRLSELFSGVELSDEQREAIRVEDARIAQLEQDQADRRERERQAEVAVYCGTADGQTEGLLDKIGLGDPGIKKYVRNVLLSDDGGPAIELSEHLGDGRRTQAESKTAAELLKGFIDILPKEKDSGRVSLAEQARRLPDDPKPPVETEDGKLDLSDEAVKKRAEELAAEMAEAGFAGVPTTSGGGA